MSRDDLEQWIHTGDKAEVALLCAPVTFPPVPSIALSIFKAELTARGISSKVIYSIFPTVHMLGADSIYELSNYVDFMIDSEVLFAHLTDIARPAVIEDYITYYCRQYSEEQKGRIKELLQSARETAETIVEATAQKILNMQPGVLAASSIYSQQNASLAIIKRVKELDPSIHTIMGGHNVSGEMGMAILHNYPSVDYVSFGEGDETISQVCSILLGRSEETMPYGILGRKDPEPEVIPYRMTADMNHIAVPDYSDFFEEIKRAEDGFYGEAQKYYGQTYERTIFLEGSRGCWWGEKRGCTFCGLNGLNHKYREKTPEKLHEEIRMMTARYPGAAIQLSDNVLSRNMIQKLLPALAQDQEQYSILAEVKTNLKPDEVKLLSNAGVSITQPGIESINDHLLALMEKGSSAVQNIALLKYCMTYNVFPIWNMMTAVPGEEREDYIQMSELMQLIVHLPPPTRANDIMFTRFSKYTDHPEQYGLELEPIMLYRLCYGDHEELVNNMGVYYRLSGGKFLESFKANQDLYVMTGKAVAQWRKLFYSQQRPVLRMTDSILGIFIGDTRPCAVKESYLLTGHYAKVYRAAWEPVSFRQICRALPDISPETIEDVLKKHIENKLMIYLSGKYLALAQDTGSL